MRWDRETIERISEANRPALAPAGATIRGNCCTQAADANIEKLEGFRVIARKIARAVHRGYSRRTGLYRCCRNSKCGGVEGRDPVWDELIAKCQGVRRHSRGNERAGHRANRSGLILIEVATLRAKKALI